MLLLEVVLVIAVMVTAKLIMIMSINDDNENLNFSPLFDIFTTDNHGKVHFVKKLGSNQNNNNNNNHNNNTVTSRRYILQNLQSKIKHTFNKPGFILDYEYIFEVCMALR